MGYIAFTVMLIVAAVVSKYSGNIFRGVIYGVLALFVLAAIDCVFDNIEERKRSADEEYKNLAEYVQQGLEDGIKGGGNNAN